MPTPPDEDRPSRSDAERLARRARIHARSLSGRVFLTPSRVFLVRGQPDPERLAGCLAGLDSPADAAPTPAALGFAAEEVNEVTSSGLSSRARSLQKWRSAIAQERQHGRVRAAREQKLAAWLAEIEPLSEQVAALHRLLATSGLPASPYWLAPDAEGALAAVAAELVGDRVVPAELRWLLRLTAWAGGVAAARRLLLSVRDVLAFPAQHEARAALLRVRQTAGRLGALLEPLLSGFSAMSLEEARLARPRLERERRESPLFAALRQAVDDLPEGLAGPGGVVVPARNRDVNPQLVIQRCDTALAAYPPPPGWVNLARLAALYLCDGGTAALSWAFVARGLDAEMVAALLKESREPGYDALLAALGQLPERADRWLPTVRRLLEGTSVEDVRWCLESCRVALQTTDGRNVRPVRSVVEWLAAHEAALDGDGVADLWEAAAAPGGREGVESLVRYLQWLPEQTATPQLAAGVRGLVLLLSVTGSLRGPLRDRFRVWADPPPGTPLPDGCPDSLPDELRSLLRRLAYHQRAAGQPERLPKSLRKPLDLAARRQRERQFLLDNAATLDEGQRERLRRLDAPPESGEGGPARLLRQAREVCAVTALEAARALFRREFEGWWRRYDLPADLESFRWEDLSKLVGWIEGLRPEERARAERILTAFARHGPAYREHLAENGPWLERLRSAGRDVEAWMRPASAEAALGDGRTVTVGAAGDPREVFLMGSWFSTCLSLDHGSNRASVIANAAEANKAVVYAWSAEGRPVARKLACVTADLRLIGFQTYSVSSGWEAASGAIERYCAEWAARAGFALSDGGRPENLGGGFWYDDGVQAWSADARKAWAEARAPLGPPASASAEGGDSMEEAWVAAVSGDDPALLEAFLAGGGQSDWRRSAAFWWAARRPTAPPRPAWWADVAADSWEVVHHLAASGRCTAAASPLYWDPAGDGRTEVIRSALDVLATVPADAGAVRDAIAQVARIRCNSTDVDDCFYCSGGPPWSVALAPVSEALRLLESTDRIMHHAPRCASKSWVRPWAEVLRSAWLREQDAGPLLRAWRGGEEAFRDVLLGLCQVEFVPELIREMRRSLRRVGDPSVRGAIEQALAAWGTPHEQQRRSASPAPGRSDPERVATDPRRPLAERLAAAAAYWEARPSGDYSGRALAAIEWAVAFAEQERAQMPEAVRRGLAAALFPGRPVWRRMAALLCWLKTFPAEVQVSLWREDPANFQPLNCSHDGEWPTLIQSLVSPDVGTAQAARQCLIAAAADAPVTMLRLLDEVFVWLHPDAAAPLAAEVLGHVPDWATLAPAEPVRSGRLRRLIAERAGSRPDPAGRERPASRSKPRKRG
jgi:hypothetical protein